MPLNSARRFTISARFSNRTSRVNLRNAAPKRRRGLAIRANRATWLYLVSWLSSRRQDPLGDDAVPEVRY